MYDLIMFCLVAFGTSFGYTLFLYKRGELKLYEQAMAVLNKHGYVMMPVMSFMNDKHQMVDTDLVMQEAKGLEKSAKLGRDELIWTKLIQYPATSEIPCLLVDMKLKQIVGKVKLHNNRLSPTRLTLISKNKIKQEN